MGESRSDRTHRLVQIGAVIQSYFGVTSVEEAEALGQIASVDPSKLIRLKKKIAEEAQRIKNQKLEVEEK